MPEKRRLVWDGLNTSPKLRAYIPHLSNQSCIGAYADSFWELLQA